MRRGRRALGRALVGADVGGERGYGGTGVVTLESERLAGGSAEVVRDEVEVGVEARRRGGEAGAVLAARDLPAGEGRPHSVEGEVPALRVARAQPIGVRDERCVRGVVQPERATEVVRI